MKLARRSAGEATPDLRTRLSTTSDGTGAGTTSDGTGAGTPRG